MLYSAISTTGDDQLKTLSFNPEILPVMLGLVDGSHFSQRNGGRHQSSVKTCLLITACNILGTLRLLTGNYFGHPLERLFLTFCQVSKAASRRVQFREAAWTVFSGQDGFATFFGPSISSFACESIALNVSGRRYVLTSYTASVNSEEDGVMALIRKTQSFRDHQELVNVTAASHPQDRSGGFHSELEPHGPVLHSPPPPLSENPPQVSQAHATQLTQDE